MGNPIPNLYPKRELLLQRDQGVECIALESLLSAAPRFGISTFHT